MTKQKIVPFELESEKGKLIQYGLSYSPNGTVELFTFQNAKVNTKRKQQPSPDGSGVGEWRWHKTYVSAEVAARRLLAMGMAGVYATSVDDFMVKVDEAVDRVLLGLQPENTKTTHVRIYQETKNMLLAKCTDTSLSSADIIHEAVCEWLSK